MLKLSYLTDLTAWNIKMQTFLIFSQKDLVNSNIYCTFAAEINQ